MKSFTIKKLAKNLKKFSYDGDIPGFKYKLKNGSNDLKVKEITILNPDIIEGLINYNFNQKYKKILEHYFSALQEDEDDCEGSLIIILDEVARLRSILIRKYKFYMTKKLEEKLLKKLKILENEIRVKIIDFKLIKETKLVNNNIMEEKSKSR